MKVKNKKYLSKNNIQLNNVYLLSCLINTGNNSYVMTLKLKNKNFILFYFIFLVFQIYFNLPTPD